MITGGPIDESQIFISGLYGTLGTMWIDEAGIIYSGQSILYEYKNGNWDYIRKLDHNKLGSNPGGLYRGFVYSIYGSASNDIVISGDRNTLRHFNGFSWSELGYPYNPRRNIHWGPAIIKEDIIAVVGFENRKAIIMLLNR